MSSEGRGTAVFMLASALVAGCAAGSASSPSAAGQPELDRIAAQAMAEDLAHGHRTGADVKGRLGNAVVVRFDSGYEVWVYRIAAPVNAKQRAGAVHRGEAHDTGELVILVAPSGEVVKARTRFAPAPDRRPERGPPAGQ